MTTDNILTKAQDKLNYITVMATLAFMSLASMSASADFDTTIGADRDQARTMIGTSGSAEQGFEAVYKYIKWGAVIIGLVFAIGGLMWVSKAAKSEGQKSQMPGWITFGIGGLMTVVGVFMFAVGKTAQGIIGADGTTDTTE